MARPDAPTFVHGRVVGHEARMPHPVEPDTTDFRALQDSAVKLQLADQHPLRFEPVISTIELEGPQARRIIPHLMMGLAEADHVSVRYGTPQQGGQVESVTYVNPAKERTVVTFK